MTWINYLILIMGEMQIYIYIHCQYDCMKIYFIFFLMCNQPKHLQYLPIQLSTGNLQTSGLHPLYSTIIWMRQKLNILINVDIDIIQPGTLPTSGLLLNALEIKALNYSRYWYVAFISNENSTLKLIFKLLI